AKAILERHGVPVPRGEVAFKASEAGEIARRLGGSVVVVKAQIHAGGRGKGGGVKLARSPDDAEKLARNMIGMTLKTHQTGPEGRVVSRVLIEEGLQMTRELYLSLVLDRSSGKFVMMASAAGGMDIEEVAEKTPEKIVRVCIVNGVGLAMATMDIIKLAGGEPANFLDVGGGANAEQIRNAFKILMSDKNVKAVLINIFGGILRCDILAQGVIAAVKDLGVPV